MNTTTLPDIEKFLSTTACSLHVYWHAPDETWQVILRDANSERVGVGWDDTLSTAAGIAMLKLAVPQVKSQ